MLSTTEIQILKKNTQTLKQNNNLTYMHKYIYVTYRNIYIASVSIKMGLGHRQLINKNN